MVAGVAALVFPASAAADQWFKTEVHVHSVLSSDAAEDLGILKSLGKSQGYNAIFVTDHALGSSFPISTVTANRVPFDDVLTRWYQATSGTPSATTNALVATPVKAGKASIHVAATAASASSGESFIYAKRGPNLRSGTISMTFSVFPTRLDAGSGAYVSVSLGGDPTVDTPTPVGYTQANGTLAPGKSQVIVWQLGSPRVPAASANARVVVHQLPAATLNAWNTYTIDVSAAIAADIPAADMPRDENGVRDIKLAARGNGGTADAYFDSFLMTAASPVPADAEIAYRNSLMPQYADSTFSFFPAVEIGVHEHAQRFNFSTPDLAQQSLNSGLPSIPVTQATGYPAQLNHPGVSGGVTDAQAISTQGEGADLMEVRDANMRADWDAILNQGVPLTGLYSSDSHDGYGGSTPAAFVLAPALTSDALLQAMYEGRTFNAPSAFAGRPVLSLGTTADTNPYPARYPVSVAPADGTANVHLSVPSGLTNGDRVKWIWNNGGSAPTTLFTDTVAGTSYNVTRAIPLTGAAGYVRVEITNSAGTSLRAITQAILFADTAGLPAGMSYHVERVSTPSGAGYTKTTTKGITASSYDGAARTLQATLTDPAGSLVELRGSMPAGSTPQAVKVDGAAVAASASLAAFTAATGSTWFFDPVSRALSVKVSQASGSTAVAVEFGAGDGQAPSVPAGLGATAVGAARVDLSWTAATDNVGIAGYTVYRNGQAAASLAGTTFSDTGLTAGTTYTYTVDAFDAAGNHSAQSTPASATTAAATGATFAPAADSYTIATSPGSNFGTATTLKTDASPDTRSYLRFALTGLSGTVTSARLRVFATSANNIGYSAYRVANSSWTETGLTYANQPAPDPTATGTSGPITAGTWTDVDVTPLVTGNGTLSVALQSSSSTALSLSSRQGANPPQLVVSTDPGGPVDGQAPTVPSAVSAAAAGSTSVTVSWTASSDNVGVTGYSVFRNGTQVGTTSTPGFTDTGLSASTTYSYTVDAFDAAGNHSARSAPDASATTNAAASTVTSTFVPVADSYTIATSPTSNFGTATQVRVDADPDTRAYLTFTVSGVVGTVTGVKLRIFANAANSAGFKVYPVADTSWTERGLTYATQPAPAATAAGTSGKTTAATWIEVDLGSLVPGNGTYSIALQSTSTTAQSLASRESATAPQLLITALGAG